MDHAFAGEDWQDNNLIFPSSIGTPMNQINLYKRFIELLSKARLPRIRFHDLRHTSASIMLNHNIPMIVVSRRLGHYKVSFTMDTYGHMIPEMQDEAAILSTYLITSVAIKLHTIAHDKYFLLYLYLQPKWMIKLLDSLHKQILCKENLKNRFVDN